MAGLSNADFRSLLMTPRAKPAETPGEGPKKDKKDKKKEFYKKSTSQGKGDTDKKEHAEKIKYRDRAQERREGKNRDYEEDEAILEKFEQNARDLAEAEDRNALRLKLIEESKYLGGDMQHTHLVKGLDPILLQKVRAEQQAKEEAEPKPVTQEEKEPEFVTSLGRAIHSILFEPKPKSRAEMFLPGRMTYSMRLEEDEFEDTDIPTATLRSKAELAEQQRFTQLSTNDIVLNKLIDIWATLRQGTRQRRRRKDREDGLTVPAPAPAAAAAPEAPANPVPVAPVDDINIFDTTDDYDPTAAPGPATTAAATHSTSHPSHGRQPSPVFGPTMPPGDGQEGEGEHEFGPSLPPSTTAAAAVPARTSYFGTAGKNADATVKVEEDNVKEFARNILKTFGPMEVVDEKAAKEKLAEIRRKKTGAEESYAECYIGEDFDRYADDSDEEAGPAKASITARDMDEPDDDDEDHAHKTRRREGGKKRKGLSKEEEQRLDREMGSINDLIKERGKSFTLDSVSRKQPKFDK